jgi:hypothetical protein
LEVREIPFVKRSDHQNKYKAVNIPVLKTLNFFAKFNFKNINKNAVGIVFV